MARYVMGEVVGGYRVGDKRKKCGGNREGVDKYEYFDGERWVDEWLFDPKNYEEEPDFADDPFYKDDNLDDIEPDNPFISKEEKLMSEIRKLKKIRNDADTEINLREDQLLKLFGGAFN